MNSLLLDVTLIPAKLGGLAAVTKAIAVPVFGFLIPATILQMNLQAIEAKQRPSYSGLLMRVIVVVLCLLSYNRLFYFVLKLSQVMSFAILSEQQWGEFLVTGFKAKGTSPLEVLVKGVSSVQGLILFLTTLLTLLVREVVVMLQACFLSLLYAFGPLALACAVNEGSSKIAKSWFATTLQVAFWTFFMRLALRVWLTLAPMAQGVGSMADDYVGILAVNLTFFFLILNTPRISALLLSGDNLASFGTFTMGAVQTAIVARNLQMAGGLSGQARLAASAWVKAAPNDGEKGRRQWWAGIVNRPVATTATEAYRHLFGFPPAKPKPGK